MKKNLKLKRGHTTTPATSMFGAHATIATNLYTVKTSEAAKDIWYIVFADEIALIKREKVSKL